MADYDWRDPFDDDDAAQERAARRAERAARRREREQQARDSLGERVREELSSETPSPVPVPPPAPQPQPPAKPDPPTASIASPPTAAAGPRRPPPGREQIRHRRNVALLIVGAAIILGTGAGVLVTRAGDDGGGAAGPVTGRKTIEVTVPEGYDRSQITKLAKQAGLRGSYEQATRSTKRINLKKLGAGDAKNLEGFLFPATYELFRRANVKSLVNKQLDAFEANRKDLDMSGARAAGLSVYEVVNVASMIEREIAVPEERELAASVIYNRLALGMPLGIDATIRFEDQNYDEPLLESRLNEATPYNTGVNPGLPPGPIGNPGLAALQAAASPADTEYLYYVIKPGTCNEHAFLETEEEFLAARDEYQAALEAEGGSPTEC